MQLAERYITEACVDYRFCNETCKETNLASLDCFLISEINVWFRLSGAC
ncbi:unnamed protein product [Brassica napus]|uniref:(rape) hypothetical protein n=1 Tax=Brassica napus TaxID=3708 RepID=A0A817B454_BRANA|nr:unnamed protein product [Brassica napus]